MKKYQYIDLGKKSRGQKVVKKSMKMTIFVLCFMTLLFLLFKQVQPALASLSVKLRTLDLTALNLNLNRNKNARCTPISYPSGGLEGASLGSLFPQYLTIKDVSILRVEGEIETHFCEQLWKLLSQKWGVEKEELERLHHRYHQIAHSREGATKMSLRSYEEHADEVIEKCHNSITEHCLRNSHSGLADISSKRLQTSIHLSKQIKARELIAIGLTEIMPSNNGRINSEALNFLLKNAGIEFVQFLPALNDTVYSFGLWQITEYAVSDKGEDPKGASLLNDCLKGALQLSPGVQNLRGDDHIVAVSLIATINIALWIASLSDADFIELQHRMGYGNFQENLLLFVALSHHNPKIAHDSGKMWLRYSTSDGNFKDFLPFSKIPYAENTTINYQALTH